MEELNVDPQARALLFDIDGTLADSMPLHYEAWHKTCQAYGIQFSEQLFYELAGVPAPKIAALLLKQHQLTLDAARIAEEKENAYLNMIRLVKPLEPVIKIVKSYHGILPLAAGTGSARKFAELTLDALGLSGCFEAIVTFEDVERPKPAPDTFLRCAALLQVDPAFCQVFEDGDAGLEAAVAAGMIATDVRAFLPNNN